MMDHVDDEALYLDILRDIVSQPTAPLHEERVAARIGAHLRAWEIPFALDTYGNIVAHYQRGNPCRPLALMAHMDHPAFAVSALSAAGDAHLTGELLGGVPARCFETPLGVRLFPAISGAGAVAGTIVGYRPGERPRQVWLSVRLAHSADAVHLSVGDFGVWDLPDFERHDGLIHARAVDDLAGCAAALLTLWKVAREGLDTNVYAVFTRAEELGLVGAYALLRDRALPLDAYLVSLEASKALPGALQGEGPVIRAGDRAATFDDAAELVLKLAAQRLGANVLRPTMPSTFKVQRQLMSGGRCEAGAALALGYCATGLAFPLGNYHNVGPDTRLVPETVHVADFLGGVTLLQEAAWLMPDVDRLVTEQTHTLAAPASTVAALTASAGRIATATHGDTPASA